MWIVWILLGALVALAVYDVLQRKHTILRIFPIIGHFRYWLEAVGPELRQYIVTNNDEERPFSRDQRRWIYASSKKENNYFGFGTDNELERTPGYAVFRHAGFPLKDPQPGEEGHDPDYRLPCAKVLGGPRGRARAFRPGSVVNVSAMSFGSLSAPAVEALNRGARIAGVLHNTGEGGIARHHLHGGDLIWQIGTGYFGARDADGNFDLDKLVETCARHEQIRAIEVKLSQGAKPGLGGILPGAKVTAEIAEIRGIPEGRDCISPNVHGAFHDVDSLIDFVERLAETTGLPVGIKSAVGEDGFWHHLAERMGETERGPDFIAIDGGEGGTGAGPLVFTDHVALPFFEGFTRVYRIFASRGLQNRVVWIGGGRLGLPDRALAAFALGCDMLYVARESMLSIGCIQAQRCHSDDCPTGVTTHRPWRVRGLDPGLKAVRAANYLVTLRKELLRVSRACGVEHPGLLRPDHVEYLDGQQGARGLGELYGYEASWGLPHRDDAEEIARWMGSGPRAA